MGFLSLIIPGNYWDSQLYSGRLYLFTRDGDVTTVDWDDLITGWPAEEHRLAMECSFRRSELLYGEQFNVLFRDPDVKGLIERKFDRLADEELVVEREMLARASVKTQRNPFPFPHSDVAMYRSMMYVSSRDGVHRATCGKRNVNPVSSRPDRRWDAPVLSVSASYGSLALACGDEGLYQLQLPTGAPYDASNSATPENIVAKNCTDCSWTFYSIYGSSHISDGYLADFARATDGPGRREYRRSLRAIVDGESIFHHRGYSWGTRDKLYQVRGSELYGVRYRPWADDLQDRLQTLGRIQFAPWKGQVISGGVALFGAIVELEHAVVVLPSVGDAITLPGTPVNWRVFPRSKFYENQLHIVYEDRLEVFSFNHDYFVNQTTKKAGIAHFSPAFRRFRRAAAVDEVPLEEGEPETEGE